MRPSVERKNKVYYFNTSEPLAIYDFGNKLSLLLQANAYENRTIVFLCIGSDRATGDCLGPILGYKLTNRYRSNYAVYGTLEAPVHAKNLSATIELIYRDLEDPLIIAIDASLGKASHIGYITLGEGPLKPGAGVDKDLPYVGDLFVTGIVNLSGLFDHMLLQTTRLHVVMSLVDQIYYGINHCICKLQTSEMKKNTLRRKASNAIESVM